MSKTPTNHGKPCLTLPPRHPGVSSPEDPAVPLRERVAAGWLHTTARSDARHSPSGRPAGHEGPIDRVGLLHDVLLFSP